MNAKEITVLMVEPGAKPRRHGYQKRDDGRQYACWHPSILFRHPSKCKQIPPPTKEASDKIKVAILSL